MSCESTTHFITTKCKLNSHSATSDASGLQLTIFLLTDTSTQFKYWKSDGAFHRVGRDHILVLAKIKMKFKPQNSQVQAIQD